MGLVAGTAGFCGFEVAKWRSMDYFDRLADTTTRVNEEATAFQAACAPPLPKEPVALDSSV
ncbi:hypothetical protein [Actinomadura sp. DC4]|uniref:hypothetical protein n=1 Tax=Actinomadura sp. DC4 TaxID=3055069 RepID=UPI0025B22F36|nr:hypothetical protein [Actinomadura sp. DC4]MDN3352429.1 hypothetical protein [Actinomadura sp. DC4]